MIPLFKVFTDPAAVTNAKTVLESPMIGEGPRVVEFTDKLKILFSSENVIPLNSCTSALILALRLCKVNNSSTVLSTPFTMIATNCAVKTSGANIKWADIDPTTLGMDFSKISDSTLDGIDAVMVTLVGGIVPDNLDIFYKRCKTRNKYLILDCAHALTTVYKSEHISKYCDIACFSFQSIKHLHTVDGGAIVINDRELLTLAEKLKWFGMSRIVPEGRTRLQHQMESDVSEWGYKFHMNDVAASIGLGNYDGALSNIEKHREISMLYQKELNNIDGLSLLSVEDDQTPSWWVYGFLIKNRDKFIKNMEDNGISATPMWRRNDKYTTFNAANEVLCGTDLVEKEVVFIPNGWWLTESDVTFITNKVKDFIND